jgi:hypothetical protein
LQRSRSSVADGWIGADGGDEGAGAVAADVPPGAERVSRDGLAGGSAVVGIELACLGRRAMGTAGDSQGAGSGLGWAGVVAAQTA